MTKLLCAILMPALALILSGCAGNAQDVSYGAIASDLSPELATIHERHIDYHRHMMYTADHNSRMLFNDLTRVFHTDHPSRLSPFPIVSASGHPR